MDARIAVLASGEGTNLQALLDDPVVSKSIALVLSDRPGARVLQRAGEYRVKTVVLDPAAFADRTAFDAAILASLKENEIGFVVLAGFMRMLDLQVVEAFSGKMLNI